MFAIFVNSQSKLAVKDPTTVFIYDGCTRVCSGLWVSRGRLRHDVS